jgi:hypothetical protein
VHISAHNAIHTIETKARAASTRKYRLPFRNGVDDTEEKARKRAKKQPLKGAGNKERMGPKDHDTAPFWGVKVPIKGPWASATAAATNGAIYAAAPGVVTLGPGSVGSCGAGTCGGRTGCGTEMLGMCMAGCTGVSGRESACGTWKLTWTVWMDGRECGVCWMGSLIRWWAQLHRSVDDPGLDAKRSLGGRGWALPRMVMMEVVPASHHCGEAVKAVAADHMKSSPNPAPILFLGLATYLTGTLTSDPLTSLQFS